MEFNHKDTTKAQAHHLTLLNQNARSRQKTPLT